MLGTHLAHQAGYAGRVKQRIHAVFQWAVAKGYRQDNPVAAVDAVLPRNGKTTKHLAALPYAEVPAALRKVHDGDDHTGTVLAFEFQVLTAARTGEVRQATWAEIDLEAETWNVPAEHMKAGKPHVVPLSQAAVRVLKQAESEFGDDGIIFPTRRGERRVWFPIVASKACVGWKPRCQCALRAPWVALAKQALSTLGVLPTRNFRQFPT